jgi:SAM-dependent methyltransferase
MSDQHMTSEAREYDLYGHPHAEGQDCEFLRQAFESYHGSVRQALDLACGTGRHALRLAKDGYDVTGVDISEGMLAVAAEKAAASGVNVAWVQGDAREMEFSARFDAAYILFNTMICWATNEELIRFQGCVHRALRPGGVFAIEVPNLWPSIANSEFKSSISRWESGVEADGVKRVRDTTLTVSSINNLYYREHHERRWRDGQELQPEDSSGMSRIFSFNELDLLARLTHFETRDVFGTMDMLQKIGDPHLVARMEDPPRSYVLVLQKLT